MAPEFSNEAMDVHPSPGLACCLFVLGMHRSGTSAFTRVLSLLGAALSPELEQARDDNPAGFWEARRMRELDDEVLAFLDLRWDSIAPLPPDWLALCAQAGYIERCRQVLSEDCADSSFAVLKDPRACRLFPLWQAAADELGSATAVVIPLREPNEVAASLQARDGMAMGRGLMLWLVHALSAESLTRGLPRVFVTYDALLDDWRAVARRLGPVLGRDSSELPVATAAAIDGFLQPRLRHHRGDGSARAEICTRPRIHAAWAAMMRLCADPGDVSAERELDHLSAELADLGPLLWAWEQDSATAATLRAESQRELNIRRALEKEIDRLRAQEVMLWRVHADYQRLQQDQAHVQRQWIAAAKRLAEIEGSLAWESAAPMRAVERRAPRLLAWLVEPFRRLAWLVAGRYALRLRERREERLIQRAGLFDADAYVEAHPEAAGHGLPPLRHWLRHGWRWGWSPHPDFDTRWYLDQYGHLLPPDGNPLVDYLTGGRDAGRRPRPGGEAPTCRADSNDDASEGTS